MDKKQATFVVVLGIVVLAGVVIGILTKNSKAPVLPQEQPASSSAVSGGNQNSNQAVFTPTVPKDATLTTPKAEAPANPNPSSDSKMRFFDLKATVSGFSPSTITVNKGDTIHINFTAVDSDYDFNIPYLPYNYPVVNKSQSKELIFDTITPGTFVFQCQNACPATGKIQGSLIVLP